MKIKNNGIIKDLFDNKIIEKSILLFNYLKNNIKNSILIKNYENDFFQLIL